jgi:hypothetical protein
MNIFLVTAVAEVKKIDVRHCCAGLSFAKMERCGSQAVKLSIGPPNSGSNWLRPRTAVEAATPTGNWTKEHYNVRL